MRAIASARRAAIPLRASIHIRFIAAVGIEETDQTDESALIERKLQRVLRRGGVQGFQTEEVSFNGERIGIGHVGIAGVGHRRIQFDIAAPDAFVHGVEEIRVAVGRYPCRYRA